MENIKIGNGSVSLWAIIAAVGGLLAFVGLFLVQVKFTATGFGSYSYNVSAFDMLSGKMDGESFEHYSFVKIFPLLAAIAGLAALVLSVLPIFGVDNDGIRLAAFICGVVAFVFALLFMILGTGKNLFDGEIKEHWDSSIVKVKPMVGSFFTLIGGLAAGVCGFLNWRKI